MALKNTATEAEVFKYYYHPKEGLLPDFLSEEKYRELYKLYIKADYNKKIDDLVKEMKDLEYSDEYITSLEKSRITYKDAINAQVHKKMIDQEFSDDVISQRMKDGWSDELGDGTEDLYINNKGEKF